MKQITLALGMIALLTGSCGRFNGRRINGNGHMKTDERTVNSFKDVESNGTFNIILTQGPLKPVRIEADENLLTYIEVSQEGDKLEIREKPDVNLHASGDINVYVTSPDFHSIDLSGAGDLTGTTKITNADNLDVSSSGAGDITLEVDAPVVKVEISGAGSVKLKGQAKSVDIGLSGAGHLQCYDLQAENAKVEVSGVGSAEVFASVKLEATVNGVGNIHYKGNPGSISQSVSGVGSISAEK